ncbi:Bll4814 protein [hydrothermal vent metagenome]|uniref:Bll4814 protein n=1 Tax=hydrothermal vent metagenome TaxID=652676 RepID=A0A3B1DQC6_9ZZZZ
MTTNTKKKTGTLTRILLVAIPLCLIALWLLTPSESAFKQPVTWQKMTEPGALSAAHQHLENNCAVCHTSVKGVEPASCIACHANNKSLLQRQPTSFHAGISSCTECHMEHQGIDQRPTKMDHEALAAIGLRQLNSKSPENESNILRTKIISRMNEQITPHRKISATEATLNCFTCHANDDKHFKLFGKDCAQCHETNRWTIPEYRHPSASSKDCAQCHQAPPSHYMMHFKMISARVAGKPHARINQCFSCHQTTSWNDILGAGWYKHH